VEAIHCEEEDRVPDFKGLSRKWKSEFAENTNNLPANKARNEKKDI